MKATIYKTSTMGRAIIPRPCEDAFLSKLRLCNSDEIHEKWIVEFNDNDLDALIAFAKKYEDIILSVPEQYDNIDLNIEIYDSFRE